MGCEEIQVARYKHKAIQRLGYQRDAFGAVVPMDGVDQDAFRERV